MSRLIRLFFILFVFLGGCFTSGPKEQSRRKTPTACKCTPSTFLDTTSQDNVKKIKQGGEISIRIKSEPGLLLSMFSAHPAVSQIIDHNVLEALVSMDTKTGEPIAELSHFWENNNTFTSYTFHLVETAKWHDGVPFTAKDVAYTFTQLLDPAGGAIARSRFEDVAQVQAVDDYTVSFELDSPRPNFVVDVSRIVILPEHIFKNTTLVSNEVSRAPIGTGPYVFSSWNTGNFIEIKRNLEWREAPVALEKLTFKIVPERQVALGLFEGGALDIVTDVQSVVADAAQAIDYPLDQLDGWVFDSTGVFFKDARVRRAISKLIDRDAIACSIMNCLARPIYTPWPNVTDEEKKYSNQFSAKAARALLAQAGWKDRDGDGVLDKNGVPFSFSLLLPDTGDVQKRAVTVIAHDLHKAGIVANLTVVSWAVYTDRLRKHRFDAAVISVSTAPPFDAKGLFHSEGIRTGRNFGEFWDRKIDTLFDALQLEQAPARQQLLKEKISQRLDLLQPVAFTFHPFKRVLIRKNIRGIRIGQDGILARWLWLSDTDGEQQ